MKNMSSRILTLGAAFVASFMFTFCGSSKPGQGYVDNTPDDMQELIAKKFSKGVYAIGTATGPNENIAVEKAAQNGRAELARKFKAQIDALQKGYAEATNNKGLEEYKQVIEIFASLEISGSSIAKSMVRPEKDGSFSAKALIAVTAEDMKAVIDEKMQTYTSYKATEAYKELEARVAKEKTEKKAVE